MSLFKYVVHDTRTTLLLGLGICFSSPGFSQPTEENGKLQNIPPTLLPPTASVRPPLSSTEHQAIFLHGPHSNVLERTLFVGQRPYVLTPWTNIAQNVHAFSWSPDGETLAAIMIENTPADKKFSREPDLISSTDVEQNTQQATFLLWNTRREVRIPFTPIETPRKKDIDTHVTSMGWVDVNTLIIEVKRRVGDQAITSPFERELYVISKEGKIINSVQSVPESSRLALCPEARQAFLVSFRKTVILTPLLSKGGVTKPIEIATSYMPTRVRYGRYLEFTSKVNGDGTSENYYLDTLSPEKQLIAGSAPLPPKQADPFSGIELVQLTLPMKNARESWWKLRVRETPNGTLPTVTAGKLPSEVTLGGAELMEMSQPVNLAANRRSFLIAAYNDGWLRVAALTNPRNEEELREASRNHSLSEEAIEKATAMGNALLNLSRDDNGELLTTDRNYLRSQLTSLVGQSALSLSNGTPFQFHDDPKQPSLIGSFTLPGPDGAEVRVLSSGSISIRSR